MSNRYFICALLLTLFIPRDAFAQYPFGKNKVIYSKKDWKVLETEHVDIYHYPSERNLVLWCAPIVEDIYREFSDLFGIEFRRKIPLVLFSSHYDFQQTNILPSLISDYTAGFTDLIKGRIAIPFSGSLGEYLHVIRHEMAHAFMLEKIEQVLKSHGKYNFTHPPLWFTEGLAEFAAAGAKDTRSHMFVRDALLNDRLFDLQNIWRIEGSFLMYKQGEAVVRYIANNFGREAVIQLLDNWWMTDKFTILLKLTIDMDLMELSDAFMKHIKRVYYPSILSGEFAPDIGVQLTEDRTFHSRPVSRVTADGTLEVFSLCARNGAISICKISRDSNGKIDHTSLLQGGRSTTFESIPALRSKMELRGDSLIFVSKRKERDVIYVWDVSRNKQIDFFSFDDLSMISSPTLSPDGTQLVFSAIDGKGLMDLYRYTIQSDSLERLTHDPFSEDDADYHPFNGTILFSSDRCRKDGVPKTGIYLMDLETKSVTALTCGEYSDTEPEWLADGKSFLFISDRSGIFNAHLYRDGSVMQQTNVLGGVSVPAAVPDRSEFVANGYYRGQYHLYLFPLQQPAAAGLVRRARVDSTYLHWDLTQGQEYIFKTKDYSMKLGLDLLGTGISVDPDFGEVGNGAQIVLSDLLGNHQFYAYIGNTSEGADEFWKRLNVGLTYVNLSHRLHYLLGVFHLTTYWGDFFTPFRFERRYGGVAGLSYPFSKFSRVEGSLVVRGFERESDFAELTDGNAKSVIASSFVSYVADNTLWTIGGPLTGMRYYVTAGHTVDLQGRGFESSTLHLDVRKYVRLTDRILLAGRFINRNSWGGDFQLFYLGGPWDLRGYDFRQFVGKSTYLINTEMRFPLIDRFALSFPFGTIEMPMIRGSLLFDAGKVSRFITATDWLGSFGVGVELNLGYAPVIRVNFTRATDFDTISSDTKVGLFIGYNY
jgi:hypothetical protein